MGNRADPTLGSQQKYPITYGTGNARNGHSAKTLTRDFGNSPWTFLSTGKARSNHNGSSSIRPTGMRFDDKSSHCMVREIQSHLEEIDGAEVSLSPISAVTDAVTGRPRALDPLYPILSQDCIHVKVREAGAVRTKAVYLAIGVNLAGHKDMLGLWIAQTEGAKLWLHGVTELKTRGVHDIFIACVDGLKGFPKPLRRSIRRPVCSELAAQLGTHHPVLRLAEIRKVIYTTNAIESINMSLRSHQKSQFITHRRGRQ